jgi:hypothetical protein
MTDMRVIYPHRKKTPKTPKTPKTASLDPAIAVQSVSDADDRPLAAVDGEIETKERRRRRRSRKMDEEVETMAEGKPFPPAKPAEPTKPAEPGGSPDDL